MRHIKFGLYLIFFTLISCHESKQKLYYPKSDTAKVLELAIRTALYHHNLPGSDPLKYPYHFHDSILFTSEVLPLSLLPTNLDSLNFKVLSESEICSMIYADSNLPHLPNYLMVSGFDKNDTGYVVHIGSFSCQPMGGGGAIGIYILKANDSFFVTHKGASSIN